MFFGIRRSIAHSFRNFVLPLVVLVNVATIAPFAWCWPDAAVPVALTSGNQSLVGRIVPDGHGGAFALWATTSFNDQFAHSKLYAQHLSPGGTPTWGKDGVAVATTPSAQTFPVMIADGVGGVLIGFISGAFQGPTWELVLQRLSASGKELWGEGGVNVDSVSAPVLFSLVSDGAGGVIVAFDHIPDRELFAQHFGPDGSPLWPAPGIHVAAGKQQVYPLAASDGSGGALIAWENFGFPTTGSAQRLDGDGTRLWSDSGVALANEPFVLATDPQNRLFLGGVRSSSAGPGNEVFVQKFDLEGREIWSPGGVTAGAQGTANLLLASDGAGGAFLSWSDVGVVNELHDSAVHAQHLDASGSPVWAPDGVAASPSGVHVFSGAMAPDGAGGLFVGFLAVRSDIGGVADLVMQRLGDHGLALGPSDTLALAVANVLAATDGKDVFFGWTAYPDLLPPYQDPARAFVSRLPRDRSAPKNAAATAAAHDTRIEPNPSRGSFTASGTLPASLPATVELFDLRGRLVASRTVSPAGGAWSASFGASEHLASGTYVLQVVQGELRSAAKVFLLR